MLIWVMSCNNRLAKAKKCLRGATIRANTKKIQLAEAQLQGDPTNEEVRDILADSQAKLAKIYQNQVSHNQHLSSANWFSTWVKWIRTLYREASSVIRINGEAGPTFQLARSVRQGCPLAPYFFIIATDVLGHMMEDPRYAIEGLTLPGGGRIRDQMFADDTTLYLKDEQANMDKTQGVLETFCRASGARINWNKSSAIWASRRERSWSWGQEVGLKWIPEGEGIRYLGVQVGFRLPPEANFNKMMTVLKGKLIS
jgi:hypothetical protein